MRTILPAICLYVCSFPTVALAVEITEIAWMGDTASANHEWIELYTVESTDVTGWTLDDGVNLHIPLTGELSAGEYSVLERTSDASASGAAWQIYTGSLVNTGATLYLRDAQGALVDQVVGGEDWSLIGGDNATKETAQLVDGNWVTAAATPAAANQKQNSLINDSEEEIEAATSPSVTQRSGSSYNAIQLTLPGITLELDVVGPDIVYVNQPATFSVESSGVGDTIDSSLAYTWNMGEGQTKHGQEVTYSYTHPGNYVVVVSGEYKRQKQTTRHEIVVLPTLLDVASTPDGDMQVLNNSQLEIDIGGYRIVGDSTFEFPAHTILLPQAQIVIPRETLLQSAVSKLVALYDQSGKMVASYVPPSVQTNSRPMSDSVARPAVSTFRSYSQPAAVAVVDEYTTQATTAVPTEIPTNLSPATTSIANESGRSSSTRDISQYALVLVLLLGVIGIFLVPRKEKDGSPFP